jgi:hypothetical protein
LFGRFGIFLGRFGIFQHENRYYLLSQ